jgi:hypothetical protein
MLEQAENQGHNDSTKDSLFNDTMIKQYAESEQSHKQSE